MECGQSKGTFGLICQLALSLHLQDPVMYHNGVILFLNRYVFYSNFHELLKPKWVSKCTFIFIRSPNYCTKELKIGCDFSTLYLVGCANKDFRLF